MKLTEKQQELLDTICAEPDCIYKPVKGLIYCVQCMYGTSNIASKEAIELKKMIQKQKK